MMWKEMGFFAADFIIIFLSVKLTPLTGVRAGLRHRRNDSSLLQKKQGPRSQEAVSSVCLPKLFYKTIVLQSFWS